MKRWYVVEQMGDFTVCFSGPHPTEAEALLAAVDLAVDCDDETEFFVDSADLTDPNPIVLPNPRSTR